jgi:hypothetical protein
MNKQIVKIEIASQDAAGVTTTGLSVHGPGRDWQNLVVDQLEQAGVPGGHLVHLALWHSDGKTTYQFFSW